MKSTKIQKSSRPAVTLGKLALAVVLFAASLVITGVFLPPGAGPSLRNLPFGENRFERAQRNTVLLQTEFAQGSGSVVARRNITGQTRLFVWTAAHVVEGVSRCDAVRVLRADGEKVGITKFTAYVLARDAKKDVALLWLVAPAELFSGIEFDSEQPLRVGDKVYHVGNFFGSLFDGSVSTGIISQIGIRPRLEGWFWDNLDQTTSFAVPGSSGGPVFNDRNDKVCGILVAGPLVGGDIACFVPVRTVRAWAQVTANEWSVIGDWCPSDTVLKSQHLLEVNRIQKDSGSVIELHIK